MKLYGIYRGDKRIKRYGLHKTAEQMLHHWWCANSPNQPTLPDSPFYDPNKAEGVLALRGLEIREAVSHG